MDWTNDSILKIEAVPELGFNYAYYLFVPRSSLSNQGAHLIVEPNNTGTSSDYLEEHELSARQLVEASSGRTIARSLNVPLLVPAFPRPRSVPAGATYRAYTHALCRDTLQVTDERLRRVDLQLDAMIDHAQALLLENGLELDYQVLMNGFSASGKFTTRFPLIHPERIKALAAGGLNGIPTLPVEEWNGKTLRYPVGIADLSELTGIEVNLEAYKQIPQYLYMGTADTNDSLPYHEAYAPEDADLTREILGDEIMERWQNTINIFNTAGINAQMVNYDGVDHSVRTEMLNDIIAFFKANMGQEIVHIKPHKFDDSGEIEYGPFDGADIVGLVWLDDESISYYIRDSLEGYGELAIIIADTNHPEFRTFWREVTRSFFLRAKGYPDVLVEIDGRYANRGVKGRDVHYSLRIQNPKAMVAGVSYTLVPRYGRNMDVLSVHDNIRPLTMISISPPKHCSYWAKTNADKYPLPMPATRLRVSSGFEAALYINGKNTFYRKLAIKGVYIP